MAGHALHPVDLGLFSGPLFHADFAYFAPLFSKEGFAKLAPAAANRCDLSVRKLLAVFDGPN